MRKSGGDTGAGFASSSGLLRRTIRKHWWKIALAWAVIATGIVLPAYFPIDLSFVTRRMVIISASLAAALAAVIGLFAYLEARKKLITDPDRFARESGIPVVGVVAPLPKSGNDEENDQRLVDFVRSIDQLRVALCFGRKARRRPRHCILITSAAAGEGKTTLSAHFAARCAISGMQTVLIDGDLRRAALGRLLDVPVGPGLGEILTGEITIDDALITVQAGGFHFLSAGTTGGDPCSALNSRRLAGLIEDVRKRYEMVIIDSPPVLPVADALVIGLRVDGALLATRHGVSRVPLVQRAARRLDHIGVKVIGAVINGVPIPGRASSGPGSYYSSARAGARE